MTRFAATLQKAREQALQGPKIPLPTGAEAIGPAHITPATGDVLADLSKPAQETGIQLAEMKAPEGARKVDLKPNPHEIEGANYVAEFTIPAYTGGQDWQWPGMSLPLNNHTDWRAYKGFAFEVYNPQDETTEIGVSMRDQSNSEWYRYYEVAAHAGGALFIPAEELATKMDLAHVKSASILMRRPPKLTTFYLSDVVLVK